MSNPRRGVHPQLEAQADRLIRESLKGVTKHSEKSDILTPWKEQDRRNREVYVESGTPDPTARRGMFHRAWNSARPDLNSREGMSRGGGRTANPGGSLSSFIESQGESE